MSQISQMSQTECSSTKIFNQENVVYTVLAILILTGYSLTVRQYYTVADYTSGFDPTKVKYDVFPSFHGPDVRRGFISHLRKELISNHIGTFIDDAMDRGEQIAPLIIQSIRGSKVAIVVLSENYASSTWCLNELVEIMNSRIYLHLKVIVVFYEVDPTEVKKQSGAFGRVFGKTCVGKRKEDIEKWRQALAKVATITGYTTKKMESDVEMIIHIIEEVSFKLNYTNRRLHPTR